MIKFPATLKVLSGDENDTENSVNNAKIAKYFHDKYPDMIINIDGLYTSINEEVYISGNRFVDGKVIGVAHWYNGYPAVIFYTENSINTWHGLRVLYDTVSEYEVAGETMLWFYD